MKIHIVQKGDTLWEIAKKYGVDFEQLKQLNSQLSSPDMIMPGMKIKVPSPTKAVQKEGQVVKEAQMPQAQNPFKDTSPKPLPVIKEDEKEQPIMKPEMPIQPTPQMPQMPMQPMMQMPIMEQEMNTTINLPPLPYNAQPKEEAVKGTQTMPSPKPIALPQPQQAPQQMVPLCCHVINPYCPPGPQDYFTVMGNFAPGQMPSLPAMQGNPGFPPQYGNMMDMQEPSMEMPVKPVKAGSKDCGCKGKSPYPHHFMGNQMNQPPAFGGAPNQFPNFNPPPQAQGYPTNQFPPNFVNANNGKLYPTPPGFAPYSDFNFREDTDETESE